MIKIAFVVCCAAFAAADADAGLLYGEYGYAGLGYAGLGYRYGLVAPVATGYGISYVANTAGTVHVAKREAEPKADAGLLYGAYGYGGLGYAGLGYGYAAPAVYGYSTLGYGGLGYYGK